MYRLSPPVRYLGVNDAAVRCDCSDTESEKEISYCLCADVARQGTRPKCRNKKTISPDQVLRAPRICEGGETSRPLSDGRKGVRDGTDCNGNGFLLAYRRCPYRRIDDILACYYEAGNDAPECIRICFSMQIKFGFDA